MKNYYDYQGHIVCKADERTGNVYVKYKDSMTTVHMPVNTSIKIQRKDTITILTRTTENSFATVNNHYNSYLRYVKA